MIWLISSPLWALDCFLNPDTVESGSIEDGFVSIFSAYTEEEKQEIPHWNDRLLRMSVYVDGAPGESLSVRWESNISGVLQDSSATQHMQLWAPRLRTGTHNITVTVQDQQGEVCSSSIAVKVEVPPLRCRFVEENHFGIVDDLEPLDIQVEERENPFPSERVLYSFVHTRLDKDIRVWVEEDELRYPVSIGRNGGGKLVLPPRKEAHTLNLIVESSSGRRCSSSIQFLEQEPPMILIDEGETNLVRESMVSTGFGLSHHSGWGGEGILSPAFDLIFAGNVSENAYFWGGDIAIDFREAYRKYLAKVQVGVLNGFAFGPVMILTGGGLGYDEYAQINSDLSETRLYTDNHLYGYWRNDLFIWFDKDIAMSGGFVPRWHWDDAISAPQFWDSYSWNASLRYGGLTFSYEQHVVDEQRVHSMMFGTGITLFE